MVVGVVLKKTHKILIQEFALLVRQCRLSIRLNIETGTLHIRQSLRTCLLGQNNSIRLRLILQRRYKRLPVLLGRDVQNILEKYYLIHPRKIWYYFLLILVLVVSVRCGRCSLQRLLKSHISQSQLRKYVDLRRIGLNHNDRDIAIGCYDKRMIGSDDRPENCNLKLIFHIS